MQGDLQSEQMIWREPLRILQFRLLDLQGRYELGILPLMWTELIRKIAWLNNGEIKSQKLHFGKLPDPSTFQCWKTSFKTEV